MVDKSDLPGVVIEGRDITTVVAPDAPVRILLTATPEVRTARRAEELPHLSKEEVAEDLGVRDAKDMAVVDFMNPAPGVTLIDTSNLDFEASVESVIDVIEDAHDNEAPGDIVKEQEHNFDVALGDDSDAGVDAVEAEISDEDRTRVLRSQLGGFELDEEDRALLERSDSAQEFLQEQVENPPVVAIVGRPNVGKSALVNRILGRREAVVEDVPGVTRDRVTYQAEWLDKKFSIIDTGGWEPDAKGIDASVADQAEVAIELCDAVLFVVDARVGATATDERVVEMLSPC
jgi:GTP-binding protein